MAKSSVSLWSADLTALGDAIQSVSPYADYFHFDIADGHFVPVLLFFPDLMKSLRPLTRVPFEAHLMTLEPERFIPDFVAAGADIIAIQYEACKDAVKTLKFVKELGKQSAMVLAPDTSLDVLEPIIRADLVDIVTILGQQIGTKGKAIEPGTYERIRKVRKMLDDSGKSNISIEADGGIRQNTVGELVKAGADILVPGSLAFQNNFSEIFPWLQGLH
jgi:ribulose-phosphate 3-epimerase